MSLERASLNWKGWGRPEAAASFSPARAQWMIEELGRRLGSVLTPNPSRAELSEVKLPPPRLSESILARLRGACGEAAVRTDAATRVTHALGRSLPDLFRLRRGEIESAPDAVVAPADEAAVVAVLRIAAECQLAVVPVGGASSVVGGVEPHLAPGQAGSIALDTTRLDAVIRIDGQSGLATFGAGIDGPALEAALAGHGLTLGHFPQSFEHSTLGGWVATRSSGQLSDRYGAIDELLVAVRLVTPEGVIRTATVPRSATGPDLNQLVLGSEGTLGVIVEATVRVAPAPESSDERAILFRSFHDGVEAVRELVRGRAGLSLLRLSDGAETGLSRLQRHDPEKRIDPVDWVFSGLARLGYRDDSAALLYGAEGGAGAVRAAVSRARSVARAHGGVPLGRSPGRSWRRERFRTPYLRDWMLDHGVAVDTFETAFSWGALEGGHESVMRVIRDAAERHSGGGFAMTHLSHSYLDGACLYFTVLYPVDASREVSQWTAIKRDVTDAILSAGGTLSHHHGVGSDHRPWMETEKGSLGLAALRSLKGALDPAGIMNPGKLL
ncbi:MAG: FAD-binding oxidoreductase [Proteobacteria bacterium]|nr:FAD-binding oxidoreductase [Pseudomonadota bacterium]